MLLLGVKRYAAGAADEYGDISPSWGAPQPWTVRALAPGSMEENLIGREGSTVEWTVYADKSAEIPGDRDVVVVDGTDFTVDGRPKDWTYGPTVNPTAGVVVELKRVEG